MAIHTVKLPVATNAERADAFLRSKGLTFEGVAILGDQMTVYGIDEAGIVLLDKHIGAYTDIPTAQEQNKLDAIEDGLAVLRTIRQKSRAQRTATERLLLALAIKLGEEINAG